jgi:N-acetylglutamate synthase-like GNAT family acetyltransferase
MIKYITKPLDQLSDDTIFNKLYYLTNHGASTMRSLLDHYKVTRTVKNFTVIIVKQNNRYIGWCLIEKEKTDAFMMFYIKPDKREKGIGRNLINRAKRYVKNKGVKIIFVAPWNDTSKAFFVSMSFKRYPPLLPAICAYSPAYSSFNWHINI